MLKEKIEPTVNRDLTPREDAASLDLGKTCFVSQNPDLDRALIKALADSEEIPNAIKLLSQYDRLIQEAALTRHENNQYDVLKGLGIPTFGNKAQYSSAMGSLEKLAHIRGKLKLPTYELRSTATAIEGQGIEAQRKGDVSHVIGQDYRIERTLLEHDMAGHIVIADCLRSVGVDLPNVFSHLDERVVSGIEGASAETAFLRDQPKDGDKLLSDKIANLETIIGEDKEAHDLQHLKGSPLGTAIETRTKLLVLKLTSAGIIDPNNIYDTVERFGRLGNSKEQDRTRLTVESCWTSGNPLDANELHLKVKDSIREEVSKLNDLLTRATDIGWTDPGFSFA